MESKGAIEAMKRQIVLFNEYYRKGEPVLGDQEYDSILDEYKTLGDPNQDEFLASLRDSVNGEKELLPIQMGSLAKVKSLDEIEDWLKSEVHRNDNWKELELILTPKYDGLALLTDEEGIRAWTRGNGEIGIRKDTHLRFCKHPKSDPSYLATFFIGEAIISKKDFAELEGFKNARNAVAGIFNTITPNSNHLKYVSYLKFGIIITFSKNDELKYLNTHHNTYKVPFRKVKFKDLTEELFQELFQLWSEDYELDGIVIDINHYKYREQDNRDTQGNPNCTRAYKNNFEETAETEILEVNWYPSKDCRLKPVATIKPVQLEGATVTNVTLYNGAYVMGLEESRQTHNLGTEILAVGTKIKIRRSGGVIPQIIEILETKLLSLSPYPLKWEGIPTKWDESGIELLCEVNQEVNIQRAAHFFKILKIENISEITIRSIFEQTNISTTAELINTIYNLDLKCDLLSVTGIGINTIHDWYEQLANKLDTIQLPILQAASNCYFGLGVKTLELIPDNITKNLQFIKNTPLSPFDPYKKIKENLLKIEGISDITVNEYLEGNLRFFKWIDKNDLNWIKFKSRREITGDKFKGQVIVFSGFRSAFLEKKIKEGGGEVKGSVSGNTTLVICRSRGNITTKLRDAERLNIPITLFDEFEV